MATVGDILAFELYGTVSDSRFINTFQMIVQSISGVSGQTPFDPTAQADLETMAFELLIEDMQPWCKANVIWEGLNGRNLFNPAELLEMAFSPTYAGANAGAASPDFISPVIYSTRKIYGMHGGRKMLPPVVEEVVTGNDIVGGLVTSLNVMVGKWNSLTWEVTNGEGTVFELAPVVVKRVKEETGNPKRPYTYSLPSSKVTAVYYLADNWAVKPQISTMNSRKQGRGE